MLVSGGTASLGQKHQMKLYFEFSDSVEHYTKGQLSGVTESKNLVSRPRVWICCLCPDELYVRSDLI